MSTSPMTAHAQRASDGAPSISSFPPELRDPLLALGANPSDSAIQGMGWAVKNDVSGALKHLIAAQRLRSTKDNDFAGRCLLETASSLLAEAASFGHGECMRELLPWADATHDNSAALRCAAYSGHAEGVRMLIPVSHPLSIESMAFRWAINGVVATGSMECVNLLLPVSDPNASDCSALRSAVEVGAPAELTERLFSLFKPTRTLPDLFAVAKKARKSGQNRAADAIHALGESRDLSLSTQARPARALGLRI